MLGLGASVCSVSGIIPRKLTDPLKGSPPPPFIDTRRDGYMYRGSRRSSFLPKLRGYNSRVLWEVHCGVWRRAWWSSWPSSLTLRRSRRRPANFSKRRGRHCRMFSPPDVAFRGLCRPGSCVHLRWRARGGPGPPPSRCSGPPRNPQASLVRAPALY